MQAMRHLAETTSMDSRKGVVVKEVCIVVGCGMSKPGTGRLWVCVVVGPVGCRNQDLPLEKRGRHQEGCRNNQKPSKRGADTLERRGRHLLEKLTPRKVWYA